MTEQRKTSAVNVLYVLLLAVAADLCGALVRTIIPKPPLAGYIFELLLFCLLTYFTLIRYCAKYTYTVASNYLRVSRQLGRYRHRELEIKLSRIKSISRTPPADTSLKRDVYRATFFSKKRLAYIVHGDNKTGYRLLVFEPSEEMYRKLKHRKEKDVT